jgi:chromodomain-helicase-DNA-binding protein 4
MGCHEKTANMGSPSDQLLFRCNVCTRTAHYAHLPQPDEDNPVEIGTLASYYQETTGWKCHDCSSFVYPLDKIIAWRPYPRDAKDPAPPDYAFSLPREYLVKWQDRSYKRVQWVPHMWLLATNRQKLRKFVLDGRTIKLRDRVSEKTESKESAQQAMLMDVDREELMVEDDMLSLTKMATLFAPVVDAEERIPPGWRTVDRVLDVLLFKRPVKKLKIKLGKRKASRVDSDEEMEPEARAEFDDAFEHGEEPAAEYTETIAEWERRNKRSITLGEVGDIVWAFIKWGDLGYEDGNAVGDCLRQNTRLMTHSDLGCTSPPRRCEL